MLQVYFWLVLGSICYSASAIKNNEATSPYKPEAITQERSRAPRQSPRFYPGRPSLLQDPGYEPRGYEPRAYNPRGYDPSGSSEYPVVLTPRQAFRDDNTLGYRPEPFIPPLPRTVGGRPRRPVITIGDPQDQLAYGKPYVRTPYDEKIHQRLPLLEPRRRPRPPQALSGREFGPYAPSGRLTPSESFGNYPSYEHPELISELAYPDSINSPYAPHYKNYIPSLYFKHDTDPGTGQYDVEYETANGIYNKESGFTKKIGVFNPVTRNYEEKQVPVKTGKVAWTSPEGIHFSFDYIADEKGYRPSPLIQGPTPQAGQLPQTPRRPYPNSRIPGY